MVHENFVKTSLIFYYVYLYGFYLEVLVYSIFLVSNINFEFILNAMRQYF